MKTIWKWTFDDPATTYSLSMPKGSKILSFQTQNDVLTMWALVEPHAEKVNRLFRIYGTGHTIPDGVIEVSKYIGTAQTSGVFVWHLFEMLKGGE